MTKIVSFWVFSLKVLWKNWRIIKGTCAPEIRKIHYRYKYFNLETFPVRTRRPRPKPVTRHGVSQNSPGQDAGHRGVASSNSSYRSGAPANNGHQCAASAGSNRNGRALAGRGRRIAVALVSDSRRSGALRCSRWDAASVHKFSQEMFAWLFCYLISACTPVSSDRSTTKCIEADKVVHLHQIS